MYKSEKKGNAAVSWVPNSKKKLYEDRYRLLTMDIPLVAKADRGSLFAVLDGIGGAPQGMSAAQHIADSLLEFYKQPGREGPQWEELYDILYGANIEINSWGFLPGTDRPLGGCAGTVAWCFDNRLSVFHAGDTVGMLLRPDEAPRTLTKLHEQNGAIYRYFGLGNNLQIDVESTDIEEWDLVLLISDGVTKVFGTSEAANIVMETFNISGDLSRAAQELVVRSRGRRSPDDITVVLVEVENEDI